jgi:hypothetical protein
MALGAAFTRAPAHVGTAVIALADTHGTSVAANKQTSRAVEPGRSPRSEDFVHVTARRSGAEGTLVVEVSIDPGWHINANPASMPFLIPTTVEIEGIKDKPVIQYPVGVPFSPSFSPEVLSTYQGTVEILVGLESKSGLAPTSVKARYQACSETLCLAPATTRVSVD